MIQKDLLSNLYTSGMSISEISNKLKCSEHKVIYWMSKHNLKRRSRSEALYLKNNPDGDPYKIKDVKIDKDSFLLGLGLGLYWGEGNKANKHSIRVGTTDVDMIIAFRNFMKKICGVKDSKFRYSLICFKDRSGDESKKYWSRKLKVPESIFGKVTIIPSMGKGTYRKISDYGVCTIYVNNIKLKRWMMDQIESLK